MQEQNELTSIIKSGYPLILIETHEEPRALALLERIANLESQALFRWSVTDGIKRVTKTESVAESYQLTDALRHIDKTPQNGIYAMCDAHPFLDDPLNVRFLREIALEYYKTQRTIVLISPELELPDELLRVSARFSLVLPSTKTLRKMVNEEAELYSHQTGSKVKGSAAMVDQLIQHLRGLNKEDALRHIRQAMRDDGRLTQEDLTRVIKFKRDALAGNGSLSYETDVVDFSQVGGQANLKRWLEVRYKPFVDVNDVFGVDRPKGVLLLGVQGSGKSLAAKAVAGSWGLPLMRLDFATLYNKFFGETERNLRNALAAAEQMAPCVLWLDEIEKGLSGDGTGGSDGGVSHRVLGTLLTWLSERKSKVFIVATSNDISRLPPELIRKGRFDEIFFVDLPGSSTREQIFDIHLKRRKQDSTQFDLQQLALQSEGFSGAEIEQAIIAAVFEAYSVSHSMDTKSILNELQKTRSLSVVMGEKIAALRAWAEHRAVNADAEGVK
ncbi:AAA family ATPase [Sulfurirhabdus autotrophica]|uniref:Uncharacterized AAA domain-containing protein ycf46 n=1 Tax=Sulfurirhabdus autotrophica TaxID=1706046 RepID=A0A4R3XYG8_9PROT|nr:AAA family ATPase [Sulfurirhabdus autotrophica]TCV84132.1 SpoVK/Ycf46/Vps4 family AAA+-type ATPase [Sulfurirhabdus autotrophica]